MPRPIGLVSKKAVSLHTRITSRVSPPRSHSRASQSHRTSHRRTSSGPVRSRAVPASRLREAPPRAPTPPVKSCRFGCAVFQKTKKAARDGGVFESAHNGQGELRRGGWAVQVWHYGDAGMAHEHGGTRARRYRSPAASIARRRVRRERRNFDYHAPTLLARERFRAAAARSPDPSLSRRRSPNPSPAFDRRTLTPRFSAWTKIPPSSACTTATAARRCVRRPRLVRSHPTWPKGALFFRARNAFFSSLSRVPSRARIA